MYNIYNIKVKSTFEIKNFEQKPMYRIDLKDMPTSLIYMLARSAGSLTKLVLSFLALLAT